MRFINDRCLVHHNPNPQLCALEDGVWDDSVLINPANFGGRCITKKAAQMLQNTVPGLEVRVWGHSRTEGIAWARYRKLGLILAPISSDTGQEPVSIKTFVACQI